VRGDADVTTEEAAGSTEVDQVAAARNWLRRHGVDPGDEPEVGPATGSRSAAAGEQAARPRRQATGASSQSPDPDLDDGGRDRGGRGRGRRRCSRTPKPKCVQK